MGTMTTSWSWPAARGPYSGNSHFDRDLRPPLQSVWSRQAGATFRDGWRIGGEEFCVIPVRGQDLLCLSVVDGSAVWEAKRSRDREAECFGADDFGFTYTDDALVAFNVRSGRTVRRLGFNASPVGFYSVAGRSEFLLAGATGHAVELDPKLSSRTLERDRFGVVEAGRVYGVEDVRSAAGERLRTVGLTRFDPQIDRTIWEVPPGEVGEYGPQCEVPFAASSRVVVTYWRAPQEIRVRGVDDGALRWSWLTAHDWQNKPSLAITDEHLFGCERQELVARDLTSGEVAWKLHVGHPHTNVIGTQGLIWIGRAPTLNGPHELLAIDQGSGEVVWRHGVGGKFAGVPLALLGDSLVCHVGRKLVCLRSG